MDSDDPADWSVERTVQEVCYTQAPNWASASDFKPVIEPDFVAKALRENDIDGDNLLAIRDEHIRVDLGITSFGQRRRLLNIISCLQKRSSKYKSDLADSSIHPWATPHLSRASPASPFRSPSLAGLGVQQYLEAGSNDIKHPFDHSYHPPGQQVAVIPRKRLFDKLDQQGIVLNEQHLHNEADDPSEPLSSSNVPAAFSSHAINEANGDVSMSPPEPHPSLLNTLDSSIDQQLDSECVTAVDITGQDNKALRALSHSLDNKKQSSRRAVLTSANKDDVATQNIDRDLWQPALQVSTVDKALGVEQQGNTHDPPATKRQKLTHKSGDAQDPQLEPTPSVSIKQRRCIHVDHIPKRGTHGRGVNRSPSRRGSPTTSTTIKAKSHAAQNHATENRQQAQPDLAIKLLPEDVNFDLDPELEALLQKYPYRGDVYEYPHFGDSDEEDRWTEASGTETPPPTTASGTLTKAEVDKIIDECFKVYRAEWRAKEATRIQIKAHKKWMVAAKNKFLHEDMLRSAQTARDKNEKLIEKLRDGVKLNDWQNISRLRVLCQTIEASIYQNEELSLYVNVLKCEKEPVLPARSKVSRARPVRIHKVHENGDEELDDDSDDSFLDDYGDSPELFLHHEGDSSAWDPQFVEHSQAIPHSSSAEIEDFEESDMVIDNGGSPTSLFSDAQAYNEHVRRKSSAAAADDRMDAQSWHSNSLPRSNAELSGRGSVVGNSKNSLSQTADPGYSIDADSDLDRAAQLPRSRISKSDLYTSQPIDLTQTSPLAAAVDSSDKVSILSIRTSKSPGSFFGIENQNSTSKPHAKSKSTAKQLTKEPKSPWLEYGDVRKVRGIRWEHIEPRNEDGPKSQLALAKAVYSMARSHSSNMLDYVVSFRLNDDLADVLVNGLQWLRNDNTKIADVDQRNQGRAKQLTKLLVVYYTGLCFDKQFECSEEMLDELSVAYNDFLTLFRKSLIFYLESIIKYRAGSNPLDEDASSEDQQPVLRKSTGMRRKTDIEADTIRQQRREIRRANEQEKDRADYLKKLALLGPIEQHKSVPVNFKEPIVYLDQKLATKVKPHQIEGIQFMWREIVENPSSQGCLLAHTMGLGKTMQVIALLATMAQCKESQDRKIQSQVGENLWPHVPRVMILCPVSLIENWFEELRTWLPVPKMLGTIRKLDKFCKQPEVMIRAWYDNGGILILGYERFRGFVLPTNNNPLLSKEFLEARKRHLLEGPHIVIADEAHKLKNADSKISQAATLIRTQSRIALTGSPLNNYLEEYHTMISWVAPGYLGDLAQFRKRYSEPISKGLYAESTSWERKVSMKRLHMLKRTIAPKVNRADVTAIEKDLPPKIEFILTIALTDEQKRAYQTYVEELGKSSVDDDDTKVKIGNTRVWSWLNVLSLLLSHPSCFVEKLRSQEQAAQSLNVPRGRIESDDEGYDSAVAAENIEDASLLQQPEFVSAVSKVMEVFSHIKPPRTIEDPSLSSKSLLVKLIIEKAIGLNEKTLLFSKSIPTLDYYEDMVRRMGIGYKRIDGRQYVKPGGRQEQVDEFNNSPVYKVFFISTRAGGLGLNIQSASRVIISDFDFNPTWEEQAVGRAYRMGQTKPVYVYRFLTGGTFEELVHNKAVFKTQLFTQVVDKKSLMSQAAKKPGEFLFSPREVEQKDFSEYLGKDTAVLDRILQEVDCVRNIVSSETFFRDTDEKLDEQEIKEANAELEMERLERNNPTEFAKRKLAMIQQIRHATAEVNTQQALPPPNPSNAGQQLSHFVNMQAQSQLPAGPVSSSSEVEKPLHGNFPHTVGHGTGFDDGFVTQPGPSSQSFQTGNGTRDDQALPNLPLSSFVSQNSANLPEVPQTTGQPAVHNQNSTLTYKGLTTTFVAEATANTLPNIQLEKENEPVPVQPAETEDVNANSGAASGCKPQ